MIKESSRYFVRTEDGKVFTLEQMKDRYNNYFKSFDLQTFDEWLHKRLTNRLMGRSCVAWQEIDKWDIEQ